MFIGRFILDTFISLAISAVISIVFYVVFRSVAEKYKKYLDYVALVFIIISLIFVWSGYQTEKALYEYNIELQKKNKIMKPDIIRVEPTK